jgi:molecular chaperone DnaK
VLKSLKEDVRRQTGADVPAAVITVRAAFGSLQCEATARAAELAGLGGAVLLQEPIAAAVGYGATPGNANQRWLVFDLVAGRSMWPLFQREMAGSMFSNIKATIYSVARTLTA